MQNVNFQYNIKHKKNIFRCKLYCISLQHIYKEHTIYEGKEYPTRNYAHQ